VLNHFSARYSGDVDGNKGAKLIIDAIGTLAKNEFGGQVVCAQDLMSFDVPVAR